MPVGIMKRYHYLIAAVGITAIVVYGRYVRKESPPVPSLPVPSDQVAQEPGILPPLPTIPQATLPVISPPPDVPLAIPSTTVTIPSATPTIPLAQTPDPAELPVPAVVNVPAVGNIPTIPQTPPMTPETPSALPIPIGPVSDQSQSSVPVLPVVPSSTPLPGQPGLLNVTAPSVPPNPPSNSNPDVEVRGSLILNAPPPSVPAGTPTRIATAAESAGSATPVSFPRNGKFVVVRGTRAEEPTSPKAQLLELMGNKLIRIDGIVKVEKNRVQVSQGAIFPSLLIADIVFVGETRDQVYQFMRNRVSANDAAGRLVVARWFMFNGLREEALSEAREVLQFQPENRAAKDLVNSLVESLKQFPPEGAVPAAKTTEPKQVTVVENEWEVTPEAAAAFATRIQPILVNLCIDCHARAEHTGTFKLTRVPEFDAVPLNTQKNLRATAAQLKKSDPANSPLLTKALAAHGGLKQSPFMNRQMPGYRLLETWVLVAVGPVAATQPVATGFQSATPQVQQVMPAASANVGSTMPAGQPMTPANGPGLPPVEANPAPLPIRTVPVVPAPASPSVPVAPPIVSVPAVLPTPTNMTPTTPSRPPVVPTADPTASGSPATNTPPPLAIPIVPAGGVQPAGGVPQGSQFGTSSPPKPIPAGSPAGVDEFDPGVFNRKK